MESVKSISNDAMTGGSIKCVGRHTITIDDVRYIPYRAHVKPHTEIYTSCVNCTYVKKERYDA